MNEASFNLYAITGNDNKRPGLTDSSHRKIFDPSQPSGHARGNPPTPTSQNDWCDRGYELTGDKRYLDIASEFYRIVRITTPTAPAAPAMENYGTHQTPSPVNSDRRPKSAAAPTT